MKLTREQRRRFFRGEFPKIEFPGVKPCPVEVGERYWLSSLRELVVTKIRRSKKGEWVVVYEVHQRLAGIFMASRSPRAATQRERDEFTEEQARGYTHSRTESLDPHAEAVYIVGDNDPILVDARKRFAEHQRSEHGEQRAREDAKRVSAHLRDLVVRAVRVGADPVAVIARVERELRAVEEELRNAA